MGSSVASGGGVADGGGSAVGGAAGAGGGALCSIFGFSGGLGGSSSTTGGGGRIAMAITRGGARFLAGCWVAATKATP